ncbi:MAG TPA: HIT family protein [Gemmatimonadaceae bacterium]|jgi:histidine triad (HIT) family protein|nr:HIT family protein [Gemmatimonadaceae bacterium]
MIKLAHCTFCDMIHGAAEVSICHEDSRAIAFMDVQPVNNGHVLVVPREHYESINDIPRDLALHLYKLTLDLAPAIRRVAGADDLNVVVNSGEAAGQDEPHYHVHIIPRRQGDGFDIPLPFGGSQMPDRTILDAYAARIIAALRDPITAAAMDRTVAIPVFEESAPVRSRSERADTSHVRGPTSQADGWQPREGAHGEVVPESSSESKKPPGDE